MNEMRKLMESLEYISEESSFDELGEMANEMEEFLGEVKERLSAYKHLLYAHLGYDSAAYGRAKYWLSAMESALDENNEWLGGPMFRMQDTIDELREAGGSEHRQHDELEENFGDDEFDFQSEQDFIDYLGEQIARSKHDLEIEDQFESNGEYEVTLLNGDSMTIGVIVIGDNVAFELFRAGSGEQLVSHYFERADKATADQILDLISMPMENTIGRRPY